MRRPVLLVIGFALTAMAANLASAHLGMVPIGLGLSVSAGTFAAGLALVLRDSIQEAAGVGWAYAAIALGVLLSAITAGPAITLASAAAFALSELVDTTTYTAVRRRFTRAHAVAISGLLGALVDTWIFLSLAPWPWSWGGFIGQVLVKVALSLLAAVYIVRTTRINSRKVVTA